ncbi:MAG: tRNA lysidine(34) synthetase TilS [Candidatus Latescibacterota bacterium]|nr:MAG: tRNA lysidine(34) synthetase TilS [Candidatus Latescibacterota bacterium]
MWKGLFLSGGKMDLVDEILHFILQRRMFSAGDRVVVAVSGGPDSVALLDVLFQLKERLGIELHVAHLNHRLRGAQSEADAEFVRQLASRLGIDATVEQRDVSEFIRKQGISPEEGARDVRYRFLQEVAQRIGATKIATAHNLDDQAETVLFRLLRGAGRRGLSGIPPVRDRHFVRPLLGTSRKQIEEYLTRRGLSFRCDSSNADISYARNKIRHQLLPLLREEYNPDVATTLARTAEILRSEDDFLDEQTALSFSSIVKQKTGRKIVLDIDRFLDYHICLRRRVLRNILRDFLGREDYPEFSQVEELIRLADSESGWVQIAPEIRAQRFSNLLIIKNGKVSPFQRKVGIPAEVRIPQLGAQISTQVLTAGQAGEEIRPHTIIAQRGWQAVSQTASFDMDCICGGLQIRNRRPGDSFRPLGLNGHKKVKDLLIDRKVPRILRDEIPILTDQEKIVWVVGIEINALCKVTSGTQRILKVHFQQAETDSATEVIKDGNQK